MSKPDKTPRERSPGWDRFTGFVKQIVEIIEDLGRRRLTTYAAAAAFFLFLSLFPLVTIVCMLVPYTPLTQESLLDIMDNFLPNSLFILLSGIVEDVYEGSAATFSLAAVMSVWSAARAVLSLMRGLDVAYDIKRTTNSIVLRLLACFFMILILAAVLVTLCAIVYGQRILDLIQSTLHQSWAVTALFWILRFGRYIVIMGILFVIFIILFKWMPAGKRKLGQQWRGALFATVIWLVFSWVFSFYLLLSNRYGIYGLLGTVIVALLWMYYCMFFLLAGGYLNHYIVDRKRSPVPEDPATGTDAEPDDANIEPDTDSEPSQEDAVDKPPSSTDPGASLDASP